MSYGELKRRLRRMGIVLDEQRARHELWLNPATGGRSLIPRHDRQEIPSGMLHAILRDLGIRLDALR